MADAPSGKPDSHTKAGALAHRDTLITTLAEAFAGDALPGENEGFDEDACRSAAEFALGAMAHRAPQSSALTIESLGGEAGKRRMRIAVVNRNMPFLVDSIAANISGFGLTIERIIHPVLAVRRDADGALTDIITGEASGEKRESIVYLEVERAHARQRRALEAKLRESLSDVRHAVDDWSLLTAAMNEDADTIRDGEGAALLRWFADKNLTLLGHITVERSALSGGNTAPDSEDDDEDVIPATQLGIARNANNRLLARRSIESAFAWFEDGNSGPLVVKSNLISNVHRRTPLDLVIVPKWDQGRVAALSIHGAIWTSAALAAFPDKIPVLRAHLKILMDKFGFDPGGHAGKALAHALTALPHDVLLNFNLADLEQVALTAMSLADRPRPRILTIRSSLGRHLFAFVWLPRDEVSTGRREAIEALLNRSAKASTLSWTISLEDGQLALLRYMLDMRQTGVMPDGDAVNDALHQMVEGWMPAVEKELAVLGEERRAGALAVRLAEAFPQSYRDEYGPEEAARDIVKLRQVDREGRIAARLYRLPADAAHHLRLKLYTMGEAIALSDAVPVLENFGFHVAEEVPTSLKGGAAGHVHDFLLHLRDSDNAAALIERHTAIEEAIAATLEDDAENDPFNRLITNNGLEQRAVIWLRAWFRYLRQTGLAYGIDTVVDALHDAPDVTNALVALFVTRHDPQFTGDRQAETDRLHEVIRAGLTQVSAIDDDRLLRLFGMLIRAILRTNAFAPAAAEALAFKIDSAAVPGLPSPVPWREIFVYSPRVEGIHLRAGPVARGGLRWSDRRDDFRTEILGLMKAQRVKNAVIVPTGAKGGFYPKQLPDPSVDRDAWLAEGRGAYQCFIRTLLSVTDNIVEGKTVHPESVVPRDGEDPYFVVAADKGTATFSDIANQIALDRGFWLGDAFASGGSVGYDHKAMGITAKGAWVSVQRHFAEMGVDVQAEPIRVAGCGDMSGDVFGNGMLLSKAIKLVGAFDHRHIFIDPDPDPALSWIERQRLFDMPRSSWADYDATLISKGGGVFSRALKTIPLSPQMKALLDTEADEMEPNAVISALLRAQIDLLWFGGIGTYIKAEQENNVNVGDPANDTLRVNASDVRARAIGEGANLGVTQAGRIAFSLNGGRINTDFIDNSAGVDCSDNEVNIKIGLSAALRSGALAAEDRNALLASMTDAVGATVLEDNRLQALGLSIAEREGAAALPSYLRLMDMFADQKRLDRKVEGLAANDVLMRRMSDGHGLTRPELAVLLSTAKLALQEAIERSALINDPSMETELLAAFPEKMRHSYAEALAGHQLRGEIIATRLANRIINRLGIIHPFELAEEEGASLGHVAAAFVAAERLFDAKRIWTTLDSAPMDEQTRLALFTRAADGLRQQMADLLRASAETAYPGALVDELAEGIDALSVQVDGLLTDEARSQGQRMVQDLIGQGAGESEAQMIAHLFKMDGAVGLARLSSRQGLAPVTLTEAFSMLGEAMGLDWAQAVAARMHPSDPWERLLVAGLARDFQQMRLEFLERSTGGDPTGFVAEWTETSAPRIRQFRSLVSRAQLAVTPSIAMLAQLASQARNLLGR